MLGLFVLPRKCIVWSPQRLDHSISLLFGFFTFNLGFCILGALMGSTSFVESFVVKDIHKYLRMIFNFLMLLNPHVIFVMFLSCYAQHLGYFLCIMFPSPSIL